VIAFDEAFNIAAPYYNLAMVVVVIFLFIRMFRQKPFTQEINLKPWYFLFAALVVFILEEVATVLRTAQLITLDVYVNGFFELIIVSFIIYSLLLQQEHLTAKSAGSIRNKR